MELKRSVLVPYTAEAMFDLIERAEEYPAFLPWCVGATILERSDDWVAARIEFSYLRVRFGFQTRNPKRRPDWLQVRLVEGPFRHFQADWHLRPLGQLGCKVEFDLSYEVSDNVLDRVAARAVDVVSRSMMDAFIRRADATLSPIVVAPPSSLPFVAAQAAAQQNPVAAQPAVEAIAAGTAATIDEVVTLPAQPPAGAIMQAEATDTSTGADPPPLG